LAYSSFPQGVKNTALVLDPWIATWQSVHAWYFVDWLWKLGVAEGPTLAFSEWQLMHKRFTWFCFSMR